LLNTDTLTQLLTDPELREQIPRLLRAKIRADAATFELHGFVPRQLIGLVRRTGNGSAAASALREMIKEYLDFCETLVNLQLAFNNTLMEKLRTLPDSAVPAPTTVTMNLSTAPDAVVRMPFQIGNNRRAPISISFDTTPFVSEDGTHLVTAEVAFDPPSLELQPEQEAKIDFILQVGEQFKSDTTYLATVTVRGIDAPHLLVRLQVQPRQDVAASAMPPTAEGMAGEAIAVAGRMAKPAAAPKSRAGIARRARPSKTKRKTP